MEKRRGPGSGSNRVNRGGSWNNNADNCRVANRNNNSPDNENNNLGFRLASTTRDAMCAVPSTIARAPHIAGTNMARPRGQVLCCECARNAPSGLLGLRRKRQTRATPGRTTPSVVVDRRTW